ncbi:hypothetical protein [Psychrobacillus sp.]|uniref:hypothetical protein n=1 Tax=Psychrobacillus sp. TaxID=1871623 RepID=UPI0028BEA95A|nr:hypothetical protein [Psychrobacillus sp.]
MKPMSETWYQKFRELEMELAEEKDMVIEVDRLLIKEEHNHEVTKQENQRLRLQLEEMKRINEPLRQLMKVIL